MKKRIFIAMDAEGDIECATSADDLHEHIADRGHLLSGYRTAAIDIEMTPPQRVEDSTAPVVSIPDDAVEPPQAAIA